MFWVGIDVIFHECISNCSLLWRLYEKFIYSEKATKFCQISTIDLSYVVTVKSTVKIWQNFVAFLEWIRYYSTRLNTQMHWYKKNSQLVFRILLDNAREVAGIQLLSRFCDKVAFTNYVDKFCPFLTTYTIPWH